MVSIATRVAVAGPTRADLRGVSTTLPATRLRRANFSDWPSADNQSDSSPALTMTGKGRGKGSPRSVVSPPPLSKDYLDNLANSLRSSSKTPATKKPSTSSPTPTSTTSAHRKIAPPPKLSASNLSLLEKSTKRTSKPSTIIRKDLLTQSKNPEPISDTSSSSDGSTSKSASNNPPPSLKQSPSTQAPFKPKHPPPIILTVDQWQKSAQLITKSFPESKISAKLVNDKIKLTTDSITTFRNIQRTLVDNKIQFHAYSLPQERQLKVLLRGVPTSFSEQFVKDELTNLGYTINHVRQFLKEGRKLPMFMVTLPNNSDSKNIFQLQSLFYITIRVEAYKTSGPAQCHACQQFGHSSVHCKLAARCVKCGGPHLAKDCKKEAETPPKCCNCGGDHTANYRKCPAFAAEMDRISKSRQVPPKTQPPPTTPLTVNTQPTPANGPLSYAKVASSGSQSNPSTPADKKPKEELVKILTSTITSISESNDLKSTLISALNAMLIIISNV